MYSLLDMLDLYFKKYRIPFNHAIINKRFFPDYINNAILREVRKDSKTPFMKINPDYQLRYDKNGHLYFLIKSDRGKENFVIGRENIAISDTFKFTGKGEKHIVKMGCIFKLLEDDIRRLNRVIDDKYPELNVLDRSKIRYELIDEMVEKKYSELVKSGKKIEGEIDYKSDLSRTATDIKEYLLYLKSLYYGDEYRMRKR